MKWVVIEGDWGGQLYMTIPRHMLPIELDIDTLDIVARKLDKNQWSCNDGQGMSIVEVEQEMFDGKPLYRYDENIPYMHPDIPQELGMWVLKQLGLTPFSKN